METRGNIRNASIRFTGNRAEPAGAVNYVNQVDNRHFFTISDTLLQVEIVPTELEAIVKEVEVPIVRRIPGPPAKLNMFVSWFLISSFLALLGWGSYVAGKIVGVDLIAEVLRLLP